VNGNIYCGRCDLAEMLNHPELLLGKIFFVTCSTERKLLCIYKSLDIKLDTLSTKIKMVKKEKY
jgi:hypothetical protein